MNFLKSLLNRNKNSDKQGVISKAMGLFTALGAAPVIMAVLPIIIIGVVAFSLMSTLGYKYGVLQYIDTITPKDQASAGGAILSGQGSLTSEQRKKIVDFAYSQLGVGYNFGPGGGGGGACENDVPGVALSCNGLTRWAYDAAGVEIPCNSVGQMSEGPVVTSHGLVSEMTPGDIIVYDYAGRVNRPDIDYASMGGPSYASHHVALYVGDGELIESDFGGVQKRAVSDYEYSYSLTW